MTNIHGDTLLNRTIKQYREAGFDSIYIALGANAEEIKKTLQEDVQTISIKRWQKGMGHSLSEAVTCIMQKTAFQVEDRLAIGIADQVNIDSAELMLLREAALLHTSSIVVASYNGIQAVPAIFSSQDFEHLTQLSGDAGAKDYIKKSKDRVVSIEMPSAAFDIDTKNDLHAWQIGQEDQRPARINDD